MWVTHTHDVDEVGWGGVEWCDWEKNRRCVYVTYLYVCSWEAGDSPALREMTGVCARLDFGTHDSSLHFDTYVSVSIDRKPDRRDGMYIVIHRFRPNMWR
jgi:hypothetical protein